MEQIHIGYTTKYAQGTIWQWSKSETSPQKTGVQSSERPVLVISNNKFNEHSPSVNCFTITTSMKDSPVHVIIKLAEFSHIQCEQIHTIPKSELRSYIGTISRTTLLEVQEKMKIQFDMGNIELDILREIERGIEELNDKAKLSLLEDSARDVNILSAVSELKRGIEGINDSLANYVHTQLSAVNAVNEDKNIDVENTEIEREEERQEAPTKRGRKKKQATNEENDDSNAKGKRKYRSYSEEERAYILDKANTMAQIRERFGYNDNVTASKMRSYFKAQAKKSAESN